MATNYEEIAKKGFFMPVLALADSLLLYACTLVINALNNIPGANGHPIVLPGYAGLVVSFGIITLAMAFAGYFEDFSNGVEYPKRAVAYGICAIIGLAFFWNVLSGVNPPSLGSDTIMSSIIEIILTFAGAFISYRYFGGRSARRMIE